MNRFFIEEFHAPSVELGTLRIYNKNLNWFKLSENSSQGSAPIWSSFKWFTIDDHDDDHETNFGWNSAFLFLLTDYFIALDSITVCTK